MRLGCVGGCTCSTCAVAHAPLPDETPTTLAQASAAMEALVTPLAACEWVTLAQADGRVLAESLVAPCDLPAFDNAAVDGYAARHADLAGDPLPVAGRVAAGEDTSSTPLPGTAVRIFTGARLPDGLDTVAMQEEVHVAAGRVTFPLSLPCGANLRRRGEDLARGAEALPAGCRLRPQDLALAAALGVERLTVSRRVRVALFSTGDELVECGTAPGAAQRYDTNRVMLAALLTRAGAQVTDLGILPDRRDAIVAALAAAEHGHDLVVTSGGVSVGEEDHVKAAVAERGALTMWRLPIKPGRPLAIGRLGAALFVGLPGNPVAVFVTGAHVLRPILARLTGEVLERQAYPVLSAFHHRKREGLREFVRVALHRDDAGVLRAQKHGTDGAAILTSLTQTQGLAEIAEDITDVQPGDVLPFLSYEGLF